MEKRAEPGQIRILIVDDHPIVRAGLSTLLGKERGFRLAGGVDSAEECRRHPASTCCLRSSILSRLPE
jgi:DNA-binding NarL/FixJ family response regulator